MQIKPVISIRYIGLYDVNNMFGHPILFNSYYFSKLKRLNGDRGAYDIIT